MDINDLKRLAGVNEATVNISMTGANSAEISDLMNMFKGPEPRPMSIGGPPPPPPGLDIPDIKPPIGLDKPDAPMSLDGPLPPLPPPKPLGMDDGPAPCDTCGGIHGDEPCGEDTSWDNKPEEKYLDADHMTDTMSGGVNGRKNPKDIRVKDGSSVAESYKKDLWKALQEKYFTEFDGRDGKVEMYPTEEQTFSGRSDRTYFVVPNEDDYMDIQDDSRFAGDIEVPDENADIMALPNSKARKLKMMYGNKIIDLGTDYDKAVEREEQKAQRRHLAGISRTKAGGSAGRREGYEEPEEGNAFAHAVRKAKMDGKKKGDKIDHPDKDEDDIIIQSQYDDEMNDIARLAGIERNTSEADDATGVNSEMKAAMEKILGTDVETSVSGASGFQKVMYHVSDDMFVTFNDKSNLGDIYYKGKNIDSFRGIGTPDMEKAVKKYMKKYGVTTEAGGADAAHSELDAEMNKFHPQVEKMLDSKYKKFHNGDPAKRAKVGQKLQDRYDKVMASRQKSQVQQAKPKPMPASTDTYKGSGIKTKPITYSKQSGPKTPVVKTGGGAMGHTKNWMKRHNK